MPERPERNSWPMIAVAIVGGFAFGNRAIELANDLLFGGVALIAGRAPGADARRLAEVPWNAWLLLYCGWMLGLFLSLLVTAVGARWRPAIWIGATLHAAAFALTFYLLDYSLWILPGLVLPFALAWRLANSDWAYGVGARTRPRPPPRR